MMESPRWGTNIFGHYWNNLYIQTWSNILLNYYQILKERNSSAMQKRTTTLANKWTFICAAVTSDLCHCQVLFNLGEFDNLIGYCCCEKNPYLLIQMVSVSEIKSRHNSLKIQFIYSLPDIIPSSLKFKEELFCISIKKQFESNDQYTCSWGIMLSAHIFTHPQIAVCALW